MPSLVSAELLKATRVDPVEFIFVQISLLNLLLWLSPLLSTWSMTCFSLPELWATCLRSLVPQRFVFAHFSVLWIPSSLLSLLGLYFHHHFYSCWIVLNIYLTSWDSYPPGVCFSPLISHSSPRASSGHVFVKPSVGILFACLTSQLQICLCTCSVIVEVFWVVSPSCFRFLLACNPCLSCRA